MYRRYILETSYSKNFAYIATYGIKRDSYIVFLLFYFSYGNNIEHISEFSNLNKYKKSNIVCLQQQQPY